LTGENLKPPQAGEKRKKAELPYKSKGRKVVIDCKGKFLADLEGTEKKIAVSQPQERTTRPKKSTRKGGGQVKANQYEVRVKTASTEKNHRGWIILPKRLCKRKRGAPKRRRQKRGYQSLRESMKRLTKPPGRGGRSSAKKNLGTR